MVLLLTHDDVRASASMADAVEAMEIAFKEQGDGCVMQPQRLNVRAGKGWIRLGPAVLERSGWMGFKAMNLTPGQGVRYQVHLYRVANGELVSIMDAQHLTTLRTGATSAVATRRLARDEATTVGVIGAGAEARAQAEAMHCIGVASSMRVFSRTPANRERLARELTTALGIDVQAVTTGREAVAGAGVVVAAVKSAETVLLGEWLEPGVHVNSVGTARRDQREIDPGTFTRSAVVVVDTREGVFGEAGDAVAAREAGALDEQRIFELSALVTGNAPGRRDASEITLFKSVGTAVQDVAIAARIFEQATARGLGRDLGSFPILKEA
ncbi:MAG: ornithine cyclodeaminase family protein [Chloroflexi bacterium]|nr:ornithine cyclodeaminase family protein [Chloroflexota bacterium]MBV9600850.1 ornithine cyclodeaminase family protein [Chloroflexota bacterium]